MARCSIRQGRAADHEQGRHPRLRRSADRPRHLEISFRREPRGGRRGGRGDRAALRGEAGDVELGQGPEHRQEGGRGWCRLGLCRREHARRSSARDRRGVHQIRQRDHSPDGRDQGRSAVLRARGSSAGARGLPRELATSRDSARSATVGAVPGAQGGRGARRQRHLRRRILHSRRSGHLLGAEPAAARHRHGDACQPVPEPVRAAPSRNPRASDSPPSS